MLLRSFQIQHCACLKPEVGRQLVNSACSEFLELLFMSWSYIVDKTKVNIQGTEHNLHQMVKICALSMTSIFGFMNY